MKTKKAVFFSIDALIAFMIIAITILVAFPLIDNSEHESFLESDIITTLSSLKVNEIENDFVKNLIAEGEISNPENSILESLGEIYIKDTELAKLTAQSLFEELNLKGNIGIWYEDELLASVNETPLESAENIKIDRQIISGIKKGKEIKGFVAKAWLKKISEKENSLFVKGDFICGGWKTYSWGEYCGSTTNTIYYAVDVPVNSTITDAFWLLEGSWVNQYVQAFVNGVKIYDGSIGYYKTFNITSYLNPGENVVHFYSTQGGDDGATHIVVNYKTPDINTFEHKKIFPFKIVSSKSVLYYEKSIFSPTEINKTNVSINSSVDVTLSFKKGAETILIGKKNPVNNFVVFSDDEIKNALESNGITYKNLSNEYFFFVLEMGKDNPGQNVVLGRNSYVTVDSSQITMPYGTIDLNQEIPLVEASSQLQNTFYRKLIWEFFLPINAIPVLVDWQLGWLSTGGETSQKATANSIVLYNSPPDPFVKAFSRFGYTPLKVPGVFIEGKNNFTLEFGSTYGVSKDASYGHLTYFLKSYVNYGDAKDKAKGGTRIIEFQDGSTKELKIGDLNDPWDPENDALDDAVERLIQQLDSNADGKIDLVIDENELEVDVMDVSGVPFIWSTEVQVRKWE